jgi:hypothetical protein
VNRVRQSEQCGHSPITVNYVRSPVVPRHLSDCKGTHSNASEVKMTPRAVANGRVTCRHVQVESFDGGTPVPQYFSTAMSSDRGMTSAGTARPGGPLTYRTAMGAVNESGCSEEGACPTVCLATTGAMRARPSAW